MSTFRRFGLPSLLLCCILIGLYIALIPVSFSHPTIPTNFLGLWKIGARSHRLLGNCFSLDQKVGIGIYAGDTVSGGDSDYAITVRSPTSLQIAQRHSPYTTYQLKLEEETQIVVEQADSQAIYTRYSGNEIACFDPVG